MVGLSDVLERQALGPPGFEKYAKLAATPYHGVADGDLILWSVAHGAFSRSLVTLRAFRYGAVRV